MQHKLNAITLEVELICPQNVPGTRYGIENRIGKQVRFFLFAFFFVFKRAEADGKIQGQQDEVNLGDAIIHTFAIRNEGTTTISDLVLKDNVVSRSAEKNVLRSRLEDGRGVGRAVQPLASC